METQQLQSGVAIGPLSRIFLVGMPGAGKSTIAQEVARRIGWGWVDTDACVERNLGMPIPEIFTRLGEEAFRRQEWECIRDAAKLKEVVIACGGGAPCHHDAMQFMLRAGRVVYLSAGIPVLVQRMGVSASGRPLLSAHEAGPEQPLTDLLPQREPVYRHAHFVLDTDHLSIPETAERVFAFCHAQV